MNSLLIIPFSKILKNIFIFLYLNMCELELENNHNRCRSKLSDICRLLVILNRKTCQ